MEEIPTLLDSLAPTPAVCGFPSQTALDHINRFEKHKRGLYAGYTVVTTPDGEVIAYVNLRMAIIDKNTGKFSVYVGSGITAGSTARSEWLETGLKAEPFLRIFQK